MKIILLFLINFLMITATTFADDNQVSVTFSTNEAVRGESFFLIFKIKTFSKRDPVISFNSNGIEVAGRENRGTVMSTILVNGRLNSSREITFAYELISDNARTATITDIKVDIDGTTYKHPNVHIDILDHKKELPPFFALAVPNKNEIYNGEGITLKYYLYFDASVVNVEIEDFPKLNDFVKRYYNIQEKPETVNYQGKIFNRVSKYIVRIFPNKVGELTIDSIKLKVHYRANQNRIDPFFGIGSASSKEKSVRSDPVKIQVKNLPVENVPKDFSGLVGKHTFKVSIDKEKYLVNEAIQIKLEVEGLGNLENFEAPKILSNSNLEEFETKSDLSMLQDDIARKVFDYTYLARGPVDLKNIEFPISFFDPSTGKYVLQKLSLGNIQVAGGIAASAPMNSGIEKERKVEVRSEIKNEAAVEIKNQTGVVAPVFEFKATQNSYKDFMTILLILLSMILFVLNFKPHSIKVTNKSGSIEKQIKELQKKGVNYFLLHQIFNQIKIRISTTETSIQNYENLHDFIEKLSISSEAKQYFKKLLIESEEVQFNHKKSKSELKFVDKYFKELQKLI